MSKDSAPGFLKSSLVLIAFVLAQLYTSERPAYGAAGLAGCCLVSPANQATQCFSPETNTQCNARAGVNTLVTWKCSKRCSATGTCEEDPDPSACYCVKGGTKLRLAESSADCKGVGESFQCFKRSEKLSSIAASSEQCQSECAECAGIDVCRLVEKTPTSIVVEARDSDGLAVIDVLDSQNANTVVPPFSQGTTESVFIRSTKIDPAQSSRISLLVIDAACPCSGMTICDPVLTTTVRTTGKPVSEHYSGLPQEENTLTIFNGRPGLSHLEIIVNGVRFWARQLGTNEERTINVSSAMLPGSTNTITLKTQGKPGASAAVLIWDGKE